MKKGIAIAVSAVLAVVVAVFCIICLTRIKVGYVGVVYSAKGVEQNTLTQGWHWLSPLKHVKQFPVSQQQIVFSDDPSDYNTDEHADWHIDAPANGGMVGINLTVNYNFLPDRVVSLYEKFNGMDGEAIVEGRVQNSIIAYVKEVTPRFSVMDIYSDKKSEVNKAITDYLNEKLSTEYGINVSSALIIDVELDSALQEKVRAKEQAKQDAEIAELAKQTAEAQAETNRVIAESEAAVKIIEAEAEAKANKTIAESITPELIQMKEAEARLKHGWVTVQGADTVVTAK
jgi:regulator of protease activity HflC (stomatin/prohibitin superfamily)|nr:MAG TPA: High frequency of lysogenization C protein [Caudoviricetes sp.]DAU51317.1 MAG TPA: High frequency of lysogenization C protein [Caudoviricetes sp.]